MSHYTQVERKRRLDIVRSWVQHNESVSSMVRSCINIFGCSRRKAIEYIAEATE